MISDLLLCTPLISGFTDSGTNHHTLSQKEYHELPLFFVTIPFRFEMGDSDNEMFVSEIDQGPGGLSFEIIDKSHSASVIESNEFSSPQSKSRRFASSNRTTPSTPNELNARLAEVSMRRAAIQRVVESSAERVDECRKRKRVNESCFVEDTEKKLAEKCEQAKENREKALMEKQELARKSLEKVEKASMRKQERLEKLKEQYEHELDSKLKSGEAARIARLSDIKKRLSEHHANVQKVVQARKEKKDTEENGQCEVSLKSDDNLNGEGTEENGD
ncbi:hypothetical protein GJ496_003297 [Pomphorhynchus laevis]|nr:hypothetical protein GJ496_003297 [Pomphorhynchus laevis]